jgi:hypothetical protein
MNKAADQAQYFLSLLTTESESTLVDHADELLLFLNHLIDAGRKSPRLAVYIHSIADIIHGLESNPEEILRQGDVQERIRSFLFTLLKSSVK